MASLSLLIRSYSMAKMAVMITILTHQYMSFQQLCYRSTYELLRVEATPLTIKNK